MLTDSKRLFPKYKPLYSRLEPEPN